MRGLELVGLRKRYPRTTDVARLLLRRSTGPAGPDALRGIDARLPLGHIYGLVGPNGAGKTTLLKILGGVVLPSGGRVLLDGEDVTKHPRRLKDDVALVVTDERSFFWRLTLRENLRFFAILQKLPPTEREDRIESCLQMVELADRAQERFLTLSTGMRQRLAIARGLLIDPAILLMDEATRSLDPHAARNVRDLVRNLVTDERLILYSSHNLIEVQDLCDRVLVIRDGLITHEQALGGDGGLVPTCFEVRTREHLSPALLQEVPGVTVLEANGSRLSFRTAPPGHVDAVVDRIREEGLGLVELQPVYPALEEVFAVDEDAESARLQAADGTGSRLPDAPTTQAAHPEAGASTTRLPRVDASADARSRPKPKPWPAATNFLRTAAAFVRKDFLEETSYRLSFLLGVGRVLLTLLFLMVIADFVGPMVDQRLQSFGGNYFAFVVLGFGLYSFLIAAAERLSRRIRDAQMLGTLEALLSTRTGLATIVASLPLYAFLQTSLRVLGYLVIGVIVFQMPVRWGNWSGALTILALTIVAFICLGLFVAGLTVAFKRTEPINTLISTLSLFLGGIYYPLSMLPEWLQDVAQVLPITPALNGLRTALLADSGWADIVPDILRLLVFVALMLPLGMAFFRWCLRRAMRDGTLTQY